MPRGRRERQKALADIVNNRPPTALRPGPSIEDVFTESRRFRTSLVQGQQPVAFLSLSRTLVHAPGARFQDERTASPSQAPPEIHDTGDYSTCFDHGAGIPSPLRYPVDPGLSRFRRKRLRQHYRWTETVLPRLITPYLGVLHRSNSFRLPIIPTYQPECTCQTGPTVLDVLCVSFSGLKKIALEVCECTPAPLRLLDQGLFGCAPCFPTLAVDLNVLDFCLELFVRIPPNKTAFCNALEAFLNTRGYLFESSDSLRKRFCKCLHWFRALREAVDTDIDSMISHGLPSNTTSDDLSDPGGSDSVRSSPCPRRDVPLPLLVEDEGNDGDARESVATENNSKVKKSRFLISPRIYLERFDKQHRNVLALPNTYKGVAQLALDQQTGSTILHYYFHVCIDACFQQKRGQTEHGPPYVHPKSVFLRRREVQAMESEVSSLRPDRSKRKTDGSTLQTAPLNHVSSQKAPDEVLNECEASFKAADDRRQKASTRFFSDTGLMALLCRHDNVLWAVNMQAAGEKQYYALALLRKLFEHIPSDALVGILYDIGCQLHRSISKWGLLADYADRMVFAISVFHAYGHQWSCQLVYHPRKCDGFGLTDGEGCERFWSSIRHLIPTLRISGYYERLRTLDAQIQFASASNLFKLGYWLMKRTRDVHDRLDAAEHELQDLDISKDELASEWEAQVAHQTKALPRQSKAAGRTAIEEIVNIEKRCEALERRIKNLQGNIEVDKNVDIGAVEAAIRDLERSLRHLYVEKRSKIDALGVAERSRLATLQNSSFINDRVNARALRTRLLAKLRDRKFELQQLERPYRKQSSNSTDDKKAELIRSQLYRREPGIMQLAKRYNALCEKLRESAPNGIKCPDPIPTKKLFSLDVDSVIWREDGLLDLDDRTVPRWMSDDNVKKGIRAYLEVKRCQEELRRVGKERSALQEWFRQTWSLTAAAALKLSFLHPSHAYLIQSRQRRLLAICTEWRSRLQSVPSEGLELSNDWGPTCNDFTAFREFQTNHTFRTTPPASFPSVVIHKDIESDQELEDDVDDVDSEWEIQGELLELAEQIEADNTHALVLDLAMPQTPNDLDSVSPSKRLHLLEATHLSDYYSV